MENIGGSLGFRATLDIDDFNVSAQAMERQIRDFSNKAVDEVEQVEDSFRRMAENAGRYISYYLVGAGMKDLLNSIIQTRGQFQQLEIAFGTMLQSEEKAATLMKQMVDTAAKTPFDLLGVAEGAKQLMAYGVSAEKVNDTLVRLGNIASGLSIPLNDIVYLYGTTMVQGRLYAQDVRQFTGRGIPLVKELAAMYGVTADKINEMVSAGKIGFADVEKVLNQMTDAGGQFYNLMEKQSASLTGQIANLEDAWDTVLNDWGQAGEDIFASAISGATYLVEHMDDVLRILKAVAIAYGSVKAAIILNTVATKGYTGVAIIDNTVRAAKLALMKTEAALNGSALAQKKAMTAAEEAHFAALETSLSAEERAALVKQIRITAIQSLLTAQQQEYLSNLNLTASSAGYEAAAMSVLSVEQRLALSKMDLTNKSAAYKAAVLQEIATQNTENATLLQSLELKKREALEAVEAQKLKLISAQQGIATARMELAMAVQSGDATRIANAQKQVEIALDTESANRKRLLALQSAAVARGKALEAAQSKVAQAASVADTAAKTAQTTATNILTAATGRLSTMFKALWATLRANPFGWIITLLGTVYSVITMFSSKTEDSTEAMSEFGEETRKVTDKLKLYFSILEKSEKGTKTHKDALEKINSICQEYNKTLLDENATLETQKQKYDELTRAIQENTAQKIIARRIEEANEKRNEKVDKELDNLDSAWDKNYMSYSYDSTSKKSTKSDLSVMSEEVREMVRSMVADAGAILSEFSGDEFTREFDKQLKAIMNGIKATNNFNSAELSLAEKIVSARLKAVAGLYKQTKEEIDQTTASLKEFNNAATDSNETQTIDYANLTFEELDSKIAAAKKSLEEFSMVNQTELNAMQAAGRKMLELFGNSNPDLLARPLVEAAKLVEKGWEDAGEGIATVFSSQYGIKDANGNDVEILVTPILPDGTVLSEDELTKYIDEKLDGAKDILEADDKKVVIQVGADPDGSAGELLHKLQEIYYLCDKDASVNIDTTKLRELTTTLAELLRLTTTVETKTANLNTEEGIGDRIKQLKAEKAQTEINSTRYKELNAEITKLQNKLPKTTGGGKNDFARNAETLAQKQLEAQRRVEEARISVMEEGYEKRRAMLELQHNLSLAQIDREEKELREARKKAGKGDLTQEERDGFNNRRNYESQSYQQAQNKLFEGELDYKRKQYELYWRWVANMGKEVADKQFASLLESGNSFKDYLEKQIAQLNEKKKAGVLSEGEGNFLISLNVQYDELTGAKSALQSFKESVNEDINRCQTLAEKIEAVANAQKKLQNGESGLNEDDRATMSMELSQQEADLQKELHNTVLNEYRTYEEQRLSITNQYALLRQEAERMGDEERIRLINKGEQEALSALNTSFLQQSNSWKKLFSNLDTLSVGQISKLVKDVETQLANGQLKLNPVDYKAVIDSLNEAKARMEQLNPFQALDTFFNSYITARKKLAAAKAALVRGEGSEEDVQNAQEEVKAAANGITESVESITDITTNCAQSLQSVFNALGMDGVAEGLGTAIDLMGQLGNAAASVGKLMSGDIIGGVTGLISSISSVIGIFASIHDKKYEKRIQELQRQIDALERSYGRLERAFNNTYWVFTDEQKEAYEKNLKLIEDEIAALERQRYVALQAWDFARYAQLTAQIKELNQQLQNAKQNGDMLALYEAQKQSLKEQQDLLRQQIAAEQSKKKTDESKLQQYRDAIESIDQQLADMEQQMMETFAGTDVSSAIDLFADTLVDAYCAGEDAAKALGETTKNVLKKAVVDALKRQFLAKAINDAIAYLGEAMSDGELTDKEKSKFEAMVNAAGETFNNALEAVGDWIKDLDEDTTADPLTGAVTSMSEETGGVIAGRLNAFIINQAEQTSVLRDQLLQQSEIARNTATAATILNQIDATLKRIENKDNSLLSQGIS